MSFEPDDGLAYWKRWFDDDKRNKMGKINFEYIKSNLGASKKVISYLNEKK